MTVEEAESAQAVVPGASDPDSLLRRARGQTLGDALDDFLLVGSASYGPAVGRPVVRGLAGYRVGITQGNLGLNDLSAMSQDHAVGLSPRSAERIELIRGPASLLYGSYSGGVIQLLGAEHEPSLPPEGITAQAEGATGTNGAGRLAAAEFSARRGAVSLAGGVDRFRARDYTAGDGTELVDSDLRTRSEQLVLGVRPASGNTLKTVAEWLDKSYGIPNRTPQETRIEMDQQRYGLVWHMDGRPSAWPELETELQYSRYRHEETEGGRRDGLFGQDQYGASTAFVLEPLPWRVEGQLTATHSRLRVCHEHGRCAEFSRAERTDVPDGASLLAQLENRGIPFAHGHPMPDSTDRQLAVGVNIQRFTGQDDWTLGLRAAGRALEPDPANVQETWLVPDTVDPDYYDTDRSIAPSVALGWRRYFDTGWIADTSLTYLERLPAVQELFWNGFHHATDSYILGARDLDNERSLNLDLTAIGEYGPWRTRLEGFHYRFFEFIFQEPQVDDSGQPLLDPFHLSPVWAIETTPARVYGLAGSQEYTHAMKTRELTLGLHLEAVRGVADGGENLPRMMPTTARLDLDYAWDTWNARLTYERVDRSRYEAPNETPTDGYGWLSAGLTWAPETAIGDWSLEFKGENLTDELARNHLSFLKDTAPLPGRQLSVSVAWTH